MKRNIVKEKVKAGKPAIGLMVTTGHPDLAEIYARCGFDWLWLDMEHGNIGRETLHRMIQAMASMACVPIVRIIWNDPVQAKLALDMGALGIIFPQVNTKEEAVQAVRSCRYGPWGIRGCSPRRASDYYFTLHEYLETADEEIMVIPQIETITAVKNITDILTVKEIDAIATGPWDMSSSMGYVNTLGTKEFPHPKVQEALQRVQDACRRAGIPVIMNAATAEEANALIQEGHTLISLGEDIELFQIYKKELERIKR